MRTHNWTYYRLQKNADRADRLRAEHPFWAWAGAEATARGQGWKDAFWSEFEEGPERVTPSVDRLDLVELLADSSPGTE